MEHGILGYAGQRVSIPQWGSRCAYVCICEYRRVPSHVCAGCALLLWEPQEAGVGTRVPGLFVFHMSPGETLPSCCSSVTIFLSENVSEQGNGGLTVKSFARTAASVDEAPRREAAPQGSWGKIAATMQGEIRCDFPRPGGLQTSCQNCLLKTSLLAVTLPQSSLP